MMRSVALRHVASGGELYGRIVTDSVSSTLTKGGLRWCGYEQHGVVWTGLDAALSMGVWLGWQVRCGGAWGVRRGWLGFGPVGSHWPWRRLVRVSVLPVLARKMTLND